MTKFKFYALWLSLVCIIVYVLQTMIFGFTEFFILNQLSYPEIWRFLTSIFLHGSLPHLMYNLLALALFGSILEKFMGSKKFLVLFFLSGVFANLISVNFYPASLGASGAIYGILGCLTILKPKMMVWALGFPMPMFIAAILWVLGAILGIFMPSNIGHIAHLSGMVLGFIFGISLRLMKKEKKIERERVEVSEPEMREWEERYIIRK